MRITPLTTNDPWFPSVMAHGAARVSTLSAVPVETTVDMESVHLLHHGAEVNHRPYLHLSGRLAAVTPAPGTSLPHGIEEMPFRPGSGPCVDSFYEFDDDQLSDLVAKGYFSSGFAVPRAMSGIAWDLPGTVDLMVVAPDGQDQPPVVFMAIPRRGSEAFTAASSGYELAAYFEDSSPERGADVAELLAAVPSGEAGSDMFAGHEFTAYQRPEVPGPRAGGDPTPQGLPDSAFLALLSELESSQAEEDVAAGKPLGDDDSIAARVAEVLAADTDADESQEQSVEDQEKSSGQEDYLAWELPTSDSIGVADMDLGDQPGA